MHNRLPGNHFDPEIRFEEVRCYSPPTAQSDLPETRFWKTSVTSTQARLPGLIVVCFGRFWVRGLPFPNARHLGHPFQWKNTLPWHLGPAKSESSASKIFRHSGVTLVFKYHV